jgi:hypothetical protein
VSAAIDSDCKKIARKAQYVSFALPRRTLDNAQREGPLDREFQRSTSGEALMATNMLPPDGHATLCRLSSWHQGRHQIKKVYRGVTGSGFCASPVESSLKGRLRDELLLQAEFRVPITYVELARHLATSSQAAMAEIRDALEHLIDDDVAKGRPILAAVAVRGIEPGLPAPWFFRKLETLGLFIGDPADVEAYAFHARELHRAFVFYGPSL